MRFETREVLAGAYRGSRRSLVATRTHDVELDDAGREVRVSCGRVQLDHLADRFAVWDESELTAAPTCPRCFKIWEKRQ